MMNNKICFCLPFLLLSCESKTKSSKTIFPKTTPVINYSLLKSFPHDTNSFTEGLFYCQGRLFESTGSPEELPQTKSVVGVLDTLSGKISIKTRLEKKYFGEGIATLNGRVYQLTYRSNIGFVYNIKTFNKIGDFKFQNKEGWGLTTDGISLIMSDGTNVLTYLSPEDFKVQKKISVTDISGSVDLLNELEFINGFIYANIFTTNKIVKVDPGNGDVVGVIDLSSLSIDAKAMYPGCMELNGIAYDSSSKSVFVTGKLWPTLYEIRFPN
jgi:glutaminyl-peptide cyclotransferase